MAGYWEHVMAEYILILEVAGHVAKIIAYALVAWRATQGARGRKRP